MEKDLACQTWDEYVPNWKFWSGLTNTFVQVLCHQEGPMQKPNIQGSHLDFNWNVATLLINNIGGYIILIWGSIVTRYTNRKSFGLTLKVQCRRFYVLGPDYIIFQCMITSAHIFNFDGRPGRLSYILNIILQVLMQTSRLLEAIRYD